MVFVVPEYLRIATAAVALGIAVWAGFAVARERAPSRSQLGGVLVVEAFAVVLVGSAVMSIASGQRSDEMITFVGYAVAFLAVPLAGWALARMEPTKWGSFIIVAVGIVEAILVVRLQQVWTGI
jgi:FtsH-binding integral membrane protein